MEPSMKDHREKVIAERRRLMLRRYFHLTVGFILQFLTTPFRRRAIKRFMSKKKEIKIKTYQTCSSNSADPSEPLKSHNFRQVNESGFGDRQNSTAFSMKWWRGKLFVGTMRAFRCVENHVISQGFSLTKYPPRSKVFECTPNPHDLPLQAEIWCYTPESDQWERLYQSPRDVEIPGSSGKYTARDIGFRYMTLFQESDGTEAMYVSGLSSRPINLGVPPPRLLRSEDGVNFIPVPQDPGTVLGDIRAAGFRTLLGHEGRFIVIAGRFFGSGAIFESTNPMGGNNHFTQISPEGMEIFEMTSFNGYLYLGLADFRNGYSVVKMDVHKKKPYPITPVVTHGGYRKLWKSNAVVSMKVFKENLYVGCDSPPELIRINPDDSWDLIVGMPRQTPQGKKYPLSGMEDGFNNWLNIHIQAMEEYKGYLYVGTANSGQYWYPFPILGEALKPYMGFTLCATSDGEQFSMITRNGFNNIRSHGIRTFQVTPFGLFMGTINFFQGTDIFLGKKEMAKEDRLKSIV